MRNLETKPESIDEVLIVKTFMEDYETRGKLHTEFSANVPTSSGGSYAYLKECIICSCLIGDIENHYRNSHSDFDLKPYYNDLVYKVTYSYHKDNHLKWYLVGKLV